MAGGLCIANTINSVEKPSHCSGSPYLPRTLRNGDFKLKFSASASFFRMLHLLHDVTKFASCSAATMSFDVIDDCTQVIEQRRLIPPPAGIVVSQRSRETTLADPVFHEP